MPVDPAASAEAISMLKAGAAPESVVDALQARGVETNEAKAQVTQLVALKQQAERDASVRGTDGVIQAALDDGKRRQDSAKMVKEIGFGLFFLVAGVGGLALGSLGLSGPPEARPVSITMLGLGVGMLGVGVLLLFVGIVRGRRRSG
jgi:hypothetical protein